MPVAVFTSGSRSLAMPKSMIFTRPSASTMMLPGFTSRWTTPRSCAAASASATCAAISTASEGGERAAADQVAQLPPVEQLHGHEGDVALAAHVVDRDDGGVADAAGRARLLQEARLEVRALLVGAGQRDRLDGDRAAERRVLGPVHDAHGAAAQLVEDAEAAELPGIVPAIVRARSCGAGRARSCAGFSVATLAGEGVRAPSCARPARGSP